MSPKVNDLALYRLEVAEEDIKAAKILLKEEMYKAANNRAYYAVFHAMRALMAMDAIDFKKHSAVIAYFQQNYVKTGIFDKEISKIVSAASLIRNKSDYDDFFIASKQEAELQVLNAEKFYQRIQLYFGKLQGEQ